VFLPPCSFYLQMDALSLYLMVELTEGDQNYYFSSFKGTSFKERLGSDRCEY
jgi:hypothetical protein